MSSETEHLESLRALLELEAAAEIERAKERTARLSAADAERAGLSLVDLVIRDAAAGLGGLFILKLCKRTTGARIPWTQIGPGDPVVVRRSDDGEIITRGVVSGRRSLHVSVAVSEPPAIEDGASIRIDLWSDEVTTKRQRAALVRVAAADGDRLAHLRGVFIGNAVPRFDDGTIADLLPKHSDLNDDQRRAVARAMAAEDIALIHGPPGTGKTKTAAAVINAAVARNERVLACAPSNLAVDNIVERLIDSGTNVVRVGHPARILETVHERSLAHLVERHDDVRLARTLVKDALALYRKSDKKTRTRMARRERQDLRQEAKQLMKDARRLERRAVERILTAADVVCATTSIDDHLLGQQHFDMVLIDEAGQSTEPGTWTPILYADRVVLAGDHLQLPATVISPEAARGGLGVSLFERTMNRHPDAAVQLVEQYRMHKTIMTFSAEALYDGTLVADPSVAKHRLVDLPGVENDALTEIPFELIDTAGAGWSESIEPDGESRLNEQEAELIAAKIDRLVRLGVDPAAIGVITPYAAQARTIRSLIAAADVEVDTVDGFQGREKEAILISLVRSNDDGEIGFLADVRRLNVALTRARRKLLIVGDSATLGGHNFFRRLFEYVEREGTYRSVWEEG